MPGAARKSAKAKACALMRAKKVQERAKQQVGLKIEKGHDAVW